MKNKNNTKKIVIFHRFYPNEQLYNGNPRVSTTKNGIEICFRFQNFYDHLKIHNIPQGAERGDRRKELIKGSNCK